MRYDKPWEELKPEEKTERLRRDLSSFVKHSNEQMMKRNVALDAVGERLTQMEEELIRMEARLAMLERKNVP